MHTAGATYTVALDWAELTWTAVGQCKYNIGKSLHFSIPHPTGGEERKMTPETLDRRNPALLYLILCMLKGKH